MKIHLHILHYNYLHNTLVLDIQVSDAANNWTTVYSTTTGDGGVYDIRFASVNAKYIIVYSTVRGTPYGYSLYDIQVYEDM